ncbi:hypothetical protein V6N13_119688 [Hibiscus sabdariffa]|uniref:Acyl-ACP thioesterase-like C-terminal domain-containing protein n=1 Tax=Hibiscus sabdariffa TaxID=183260 RepID=A0ABR2E209_9ROSI
MQVARPSERGDQTLPYCGIRPHQRYPVPRIQTMDHVISGLTPGWHDLDVNYHVNNAKYLDWILETTPDSIICSHELWKINFQYRKECLKEDVIQSLSRLTTNDRGVELEHLLRLDSGIQVLRATTAWPRLPLSSSGNTNVLPNLNK